MKQSIYILTIIIGLVSCNNQPKNIENITVTKTDITLNDNDVYLPNDTFQSERQQDTLKSEISDNTSREIKELKDSIIYFDENLFKDLDSELKVVSDSKFKDYLKAYKTNCELDKSGFIKGKGLIFDRYCNEICETYLIDKKKKITVALPSDYDQGIIGLMVSPSCNQFIVYSSYDGSDYTNYYGHRAEVFGFTIGQGHGIEIIKPTFKFYTRNWSIEEVIWVNDNEIAIKAYEENRSLANQENLHYKFFKSRVIN